MRASTIIGAATCLSLVAVLILPAFASAGDVENGALVYDHRCVQCHGVDGDGKGPGADFMLPRPRIFGDNGSYKFRTTPPAELPTDQDLFHIISVGIPGSSMPRFDVLPEQEIWDVIEYIKSLNEDFADEEFMETAVTMDPLLGEIIAPPSTLESIAAGKEAFTTAQCQTCHGEMGRGNGSAGQELKDDWGTPILPRNLTNPESYRGGSTSYDIFRTITTGLNGSPMASYAESLSDEQRWNVVHYVESLHPPKKKSRDEIILASRVDEIPVDEEGWAEVAAARFKLLPNMITPPRLFWSSVEFLSVQALYTSDEIAMRIQWDDRTESAGTNTDHTYEDRDTKVYRDTDHPDQFAVQFPVKNDPSVRPYFMMGDGKRAVNLWWWQSDADGILEMNAKGFGSQRSQAEVSQQLEGGVTYTDGRYTMIVRRPITTDLVKRDAQFETGVFTPIAFSAWDGSRGEVGNRRNVSTWYWLYLRAPLPETVNTYPPFAFFLSLGLLLIVVSAVRRRVGDGGEGEGDETEA
jgi:DMSO reductase family type II enzyme heme b subunit